MFDTTCANRKAWECDFPTSNEDTPFLISCDTAVGGITWEEHCVECGQPECFRMCRMYERAFDGKCRRFEGGIVPIQVAGKVLHGCVFRKWSKLEGQFSGNVLKFKWAIRLARADRIFAFLAQMVNRAMFFIPGRIGAITIYRRLKLWASRVFSRKSNARISGLVLKCWTSRPVKLHLSIIHDDKNILDNVLDLKNEWQSFSMTFNPVPKGSRFLLFSTEEDPFTLIMDTLELLPSAYAPTSNQKLDSTATKKVPAKFVKCLAWDLDNTIWKGILVEDGAENLILNEDAVSLIKALDSRGILNTIISKNDYEPAWKVLERFGLSEYFVFPSINWQPKSSNLKTSAKAINIGLDTFAFVDDSPFERAEVGEKLPMVRVFEHTRIRDMVTLPEFNPPASSEGSKRRLSYQKEMQRVAAAQSFDGDYTEFLRSCKIELSLFPLKHESKDIYERCYELIQRTNQLTLAGRRYTPDQFAELIAPDYVEAWGIRCKDRFGDYGIVGVVITSHEGCCVSINEFVMSCRVAKKQCEYSVIHALAKDAEKNGAEILTARLVMTGRNTALVSAFDEMPFEKSEVSNNEVFDYTLQLGGSKIPDSVNKVVLQ